MTSFNVGKFVFVNAHSYLVPILNVPLHGRNTIHKEVLHFVAFIQVLNLESL